MKIAIVINTSWNIYNFRLGLARYLHQLGHQVYFLAPRDQYTYKIANECEQYFELKIQNTGSNPLKDLGLLYQFLKIYKSLKPDIILNYTIKPNIYGSIAGQLLGIPLINNVSGLGTVFTHRTITSKVAIVLYKVAFRGKMTVFFQNEMDKMEFIKATNIKVTTKVIPGSGINIAKHQPYFDELSSGNSFLMVGRLLVDKGVLEYLAAARMVLEAFPRAKFFLAGGHDPSHVRGVAMEEIKEFERNGTIQYLGHVNEIADEMIKYDWVVLPSYREGTSRVLLEAAAQGIPMIATDVAGCNNVVVNDYNGLLCKVKDANDLAEKMKMALEMPINVRKQMSKNSRKIAEEKFDERLIFAAYSESISKLTAKD